MNRMDALQVFVKVAELASFTQAALALNLPRATVSKAVQQLEAQLGARLLQRTTRQVQLTQEGQAAYERGRELLAGLDDLQGMFRRTPVALAGRLRVDMSSGIARHAVIPRLPEFLLAHPGLSLELSSTDRLVDVVREGFDCVLRAGGPRDFSLVGRPLGHMMQINYASPAYLSRYGTPQRLEDLARHRLVHYASVLGARPLGWEYHERGRSRAVEMGGVLTVNNADAYMAACLAGLGMIQAPLLGGAAHLASGDLVEVLPRYRAAPLPLTLLYPDRRVPPRVRVFMEWLEDVVGRCLAEFQSEPPPDSV